MFFFSSIYNVTFYFPIFLIRWFLFIVFFFSLKSAYYCKSFLPTIRGAPPGNVFLYPTVKLAPCHSREPSDCCKDLSSPQRYRTSQCGPHSRAEKYRTVRSARPIVIEEFSGADRLDITADVAFDFVSEAPPFFRWSWSSPRAFFSKSNTKKSFIRPDTKSQFHTISLSRLFCPESRTRNVS